MRKKQILLLIIGCLSLATTITGLIMIIIGIGVYGATFVIGLYMFAISAIVCIPCLSDAYRLFKSNKNTTAEKQEYSNEQPNTSSENQEMIEVIKDIVVETHISMKNRHKSHYFRPMRHMIRRIAGTCTSTHIGKSSANQIMHHRNSLCGKS